MTIPTDDDLLRQITAAESTIAVCERNIKVAKQDLLERRSKEIDALLKAKDEPYGVVKITVGNHQVDVTTPKKVTYDQKVLAEKRKEIADSGENPDMYIKAKYDISETAYKAFPQEVREYLAPARTVTPGTMTIKIVPDKE